MNREDYIRAITHQLEIADKEALYLLWIAARNLTRTEAAQHE